MTARGGLHEGVNTCVQRKESHHLSLRHRVKIHHVIGTLEAPPGPPANQEVTPS